MAAFDFDQDPFVNFDIEYRRYASHPGVLEPTAMICGTVDDHGDVTTRTVLMKSYQNQRIRFFTNYDSQKARQIDQTSKISLLFYWPEFFQQVRIEGLAHRISRSESESYFASRPRLSQIGAWASAQSTRIPGPEFLQKQVEEIELKFREQDVPCPSHWGGYDVSPLRMVFWYGREGRLHDRFVYERKDISSETWDRYYKSP